MSTHTEDLQIPTTILTQMGVTDVLPKIGRGESLPYSGYRNDKTGKWVTITNGYCKRRAVL